MRPFEPVVKALPISYCELFTRTILAAAKLRPRETRAGSNVICSRTRTLHLLVPCALAAVALAACSHSGSGSDALTPAQAEGKQAYTIACMRCHEPYDLQTADDGPSLRGLFKKPTLPSGAPATDEQLRNVVLHGSGRMRPADPAKLSREDIEPLIQYLHTR
jgi:hypothetical protein